MHGFNPVLKQLSHSIHCHSIPLCFIRMMFGSVLFLLLKSQNGLGEIEVPIWVCLKMGKTPQKMHGVLHSNYLKLAAIWDSFRAIEASFQ